MDPAHRTLIEALHRVNRPGVLVATGGGASAIAMLLAVPGASRTILEALVPYHTNSLADFLGHVPQRACTPETSRAIAAAARHRATKIAAGLPVFGLGCTAALATDQPKRGNHRCHVSVRTRTTCTTYSLKLAKGKRDRGGEETVVAAILLDALAEVLGIPERVPIPLLPGEDIELANEHPTDTLSRLYRGETPAACLEPDGRMVPDGPNPKALLSGSFNPLHHGHTGLAEVVEKRLGVSAVYELCIHNADKPALPIEEAERRLAQFAGWGTVWLTRAATFADKAALFPGTVFVVGVDTAERIIHPRFYGDETARDAALAGFKERGCWFLVAGRRTPSGAFLPVESLDLPAPYRNLFEGLPEEEFRVDVSSTELRGR